jgi:plasmid stabilization system protein ParE
LNISFHPGASRDAGDAFRFYHREAGHAIANRFLLELERVARLLSEFPDLGTPTQGERRTYPLTGFPYSIIYQASGETIRVLVVRHQSRDPNQGETRR